MGFWGKTFNSLAVNREAVALRKLSADRVALLLKDKAVLSHVCYRRYEAILIKLKARNHMTLDKLACHVVGVCNGGPCVCNTLARHNLIELKGLITPIFRIA
jgi:hypothetical protein